MTGRGRGRGLSGHVGNVLASDTLLLEISGFLHHRDVGQILTLSLEQHWSEFKLELQRKKKETGGPTQKIPGATRQHDKAVGRKSVLLPALLL